MIKKYKYLLVAVVMSAFALVLPMQSVHATDPANKINQGVKAAGGGSSGGINASLQDVVNLLLFLVGAIAVIMIVVGGLRYTLSGGDQSAVKAAKDTILYAVVGLVVAILAYAIVNFVVDAF